ncbi:MAG: hypothetical protein ACI9YL_000388 [Luteibaculaceae bacterium]|jgi:hypothetical protein
MRLRSILCLVFLGSFVCSQAQSKLEKGVSLGIQRLKTYDPPGPSTRTYWGTGFQLGFILSKQTSSQVVLSAEPGFNYYRFSFLQEDGDKTIRKYKESQIAASIPLIFQYYPNEFQRFFVEGGAFGSRLIKGTKTGIYKIADPNQAQAKKWDAGGVLGLGYWLYPFGNVKMELVFRYSLSAKYIFPDDEGFFGEALGAQSGNIGVRFKWRD